MSRPTVGSRECRRIAGGRWNIRVVVLGGIALVAGCTSDGRPSAPTLDRAFLTGAAAAALRSDGKFAMPDSVVNPPGQITRAQAVTIARRYVKDVGPSLIGPWSTVFGSPLALAELAACKSPLYAATPYTAIVGDVSDAVAKELGPHWIVPICTSGGRIAVVLSFSARATTLVVPADANPQYELADMLSVGIPEDADVSWYEPESAAALAFARTGVRVTEVPTLVMNPRPEAPLLVRWKVPLEAPVTVVGKKSGASRSRTAVLAGFGVVFRESGLLDVAPDTAPRSSMVDRNTKATLQLSLSPEAPAPVEPVTPGKP